jgi:LysR family transcriptional regulator, regulator for genes of the gallate degradation pathway
MKPALSNLKHLQLFLEVVRWGSVSGAARAMHLSQPAVSQALASIEAHMGGALLIRSAGGLQLNPAGEVVAARVGRALAHLEEPLAAVRGRGGGGRDSALRGITAAQLDALVGVGEHGSFAAAAQRASCTRAALHRALRQLEMTTGVAMARPVAGRLLLTREGERLAHGARLAAAEMRQAGDELAQARGGGGGRSVIGAMPLARTLIVPRAVLAFAAEEPRHVLSILDGPYDTLLSALRRGEADVLVGALRDPPPADDVVQEHLFDDPLALIMRAGHPLARRRLLDDMALARFGWIAPRPESPLRRQFEALHARLGTRASAAPIECNSLVAARALLLESDRLMLLSAHQVRHEVWAGQLVTRPHPLGRVFRPIGLTLRKDWHPTPAQSRLLGLLRSMAQQEGVAAASSLQRTRRPAAPSPARKSRGERRWKRAKKRLK